jgi:hypothetical protein
MNALAKLGNVIEIVDVGQGTQEWHDARCGMPTASEFQKVLSPRAGKEGIGRKTYLRKLAGEIIAGEPYIDPYTNPAFERGKAMEAEARKYYALVTGERPTKVGFVRFKHPTSDVFAAGCSPDSLIGDDGMLEIKTAAPHILIEYLEKPAGYFPPEHVAQVQGGLLVTGRKWADLIIYWPKLPAFIRRVDADFEYQALLIQAIAEFNFELRQLVKYLETIT